MAKGLATLIRVNKWGVDEKRRELGVRLKELESLENALVNLAEELKHEQHTANQFPETAGFFYGNYADAVIQRRTELQNSIAAKEEEISIAREQLGEAYRSLKKYEVVYQNQQRQAANDLARMDQLELDELGQQSRSFRERWQPEK